MCVGLLLTGAKATFVKGDVVVCSAPDACTRLKRGTELGAGSVVKTGADGRTELAFANADVLRVGPASELQIDMDEKGKIAHVLVTLGCGRVWSNVSRLRDDRWRFTVRTASAVVGVRFDTRAKEARAIFRLASDDDGASLVKVYAGNVSVGLPYVPAGSARREWYDNTFELLLGKAMLVRMRSQAMDLGVPEAFTDADDEKDDPAWLHWNLARDAGRSGEASD